MPPDPKPPRRVQDAELLRNLHISWRGECVIAGDDCRRDRFSLHHVHNKPRDDVQPNLVMLCGDGTTGHHGLITEHDHPTCIRLAHYLVTERLDTMEYLGRKLGGVNAVREWLRWQLHYDLAGVTVR